jgi:TRAP-type C4-dicarboxylate transport system substrate-binding protein
MKKIRSLGLLSIFAASLVIADVQAATTWNVSLWGKRRAFTEHVEKLAELVDQKTKGDFTLNISYGGLSKDRENLDGISIGAFEMAQFCSFYHAGKNPTITVNELPYTKDVSLARVAEIYSKVYEHPIVKKDLARWNATLLMPTPLPQYNIIGIAKGDLADRVKSADFKFKLEDFQGMRVRGPGGIMGVLSKLGAVKTGVPFGEVRQAMDSGVIDAATFAPHAHLATKTTAVGDWATTNLNLGSADCPVVVNTDALNDLKPAHKKALMDSIPAAMTHYVENYENNTTKKYQQEIEAKGIKMVTFTPEQVDQLNELATSVREDWIEQYKNDFDSKTLFEFAEALFLGKIK